MTLAPYIKQIAEPEAGRGALSEAQAHDLFAALLDGGATDLEIGAVLMGLRMRDASTAQLSGFQRALAARTYRLRPPLPALKPVVFATCHRLGQEPNLLPLLALMLQRLGVPVLIHGSLDGAGGAAAVHVLRQFGILPCVTLAQAQKALDEQLLAFVATAALCPAIALLLALRHCLGTSNIAHTLVRLIDPFQGSGIRVVSSGRPALLAQLESVLADTGHEALLLFRTDGEAFASPHRRPRILHVADGQSRVLFEEEARGMVSLPEGLAGETTAAWIAKAMDGQAPVPYPLINQLACCLYVSRYTEDMNQAKAIAAVEARRRGSAAAAAFRGRRLNR